MKTLRGLIAGYLLWICLIAMLIFSGSEFGCDRGGIGLCPTPITRYCGGPTRSHASYGTGGSDEQFL
jgi:hypothetical protein